LRRWSDLLHPFKLVVTSRDYPALRKTFNNVSHLIQLRSGDGVDAAASNDVRIFLSGGFKQIADENDLMEWPGSSKIGELVKYSAGLVIWAATVLGFIRDGDPEERLSLVSDNLGEVGAPIDNLYRQILEVACKSLNGAEMKSFETVLGAVVLAKDPLQYVDILKLFKLSDVQ
jgi:hypothetical protein